MGEWATKKPPEPSLHWKECELISISLKLYLRFFKPLEDRFLAKNGRVYNFLEISVHPKTDIMDWNPLGKIPIFLLFGWGPFPPGSTLEFLLYGHAVWIHSTPKASYPW